jgi:hypothetical protein
MEFNESVILSVMYHRQSISESTSLSSLYKFCQTPAVQLSGRSTLSDLTDSGLTKCLMSGWRLQNNNVITCVVWL